MGRSAKVPIAKPPLSDADALALAQRDLQEKRRQNNIALIGIAVTFLVALISLVWNSLIQRQASHTSDVLERTRVASGEVVTNSNDFAHVWSPWIESVSPITMSLGVGRDVRFERPFRTAPKVTLSLSALDFPDMAAALTHLGFTPREPGLQSRLRHVNVATEVTDVTPNGFRLYFGIGLPTEAAKFLESHLTSPALVDQAVVSDMRVSRMLENRPQLTPDEVWMSNFYTTIGTFTVTWIAQAEEAQTKGS
jgi:hypothetical protein